MPRSWQPPCCTDTQQSLHPVMHAICGPMSVRELWGIEGVVLHGIMPAIKWKYYYTVNAKLYVNIYLKLRFYSLIWQRNDVQTTIFSIFSKTQFFLPQLLKFKLLIRKAWEKCMLVIRYDILRIFNWNLPMAFFTIPYKIHKICTCNAYFTESQKSCPNFWWCA